MHFWDFVRMAIIALGFVLGAANFSVLFLHYRAWRAIKDKDAVAGLLPLHVATIAASYGILTYALVAGVWSTMGQPGTWRLPLYLIGFALGLVALGVMATRQRRRIKFCPTATTVTVTEDTKTTQEE